jgi:hypothetical protein
MKRSTLVEKLIKEGMSEKTLVKFTDKQLLELSERMLNEQEVGGYKEGPGEKLTPELKHYNTIVKPQLSKAGFKDSYDKVMEPYGTENSMVYGNHNTGVNVVWDRKKGVYTVYVGNNKGLKTFSLGPNDPKLVANNVVKYALSLKNGLTNLSEQVKKGSVVMSKGTSNPDDLKKYTDQGLNVELREKEKEVGKELKGNQKKLDKNHNGKIDGQDFKILKGQKKKETTKTDKKDKEVKEWVESLAENNYHSFTSKNEIMEMIQFKLQEAGPNVNIGHNDVPEFMTYESSSDGDVETKPSKPKVTPGTKPKPHNPNQPGPFTKPKPKAEKK